MPRPFRALLLVLVVLLIPGAAGAAPPPDLPQRFDHLVAGTNAAGGGLFEQVEAAWRSGDAATVQGLLERWVLIRRTARRNMQDATFLSTHAKAPLDRVLAEADLEIAAYEEAVRTLRSGGTLAPEDYGRLRVLTARRSDASSLLRAALAGTPRDAAAAVAEPSFSDAEGVGAFLAPFLLIALVVGIVGGVDLLLLRGRTPARP